MASSRSLQSIVGIASWVVVVLSVLGPFLFPVGVLWLYAALGLFALGNSLITVCFGQVTLRHIRKAIKTSYETEYELVAQTLKTPVLAWDDVVHAVIIPNYCEPINLMRETIAAVSTQREASKTILVLAMEQREVGCEEKARLLIEEFGHCFRHVLHTVHPPNLQNELAGKASNEAWAARKLHAYVLEANIPVDNVVVTIADADSLLPSNYLACLSFHFATNAARYRRFFQGHITFFRNVYAVPPITGILDMLMSTDHLAWLSTRDPLIPLSTYSVSLQLLHNIHYWDTDYADEDFHLFCKASLLSGYDDVTTVPLYVPVDLTSCQAPTIFRSIYERFDQARRHAMGARTIGYVIGIVMTTKTKANWIKLLFGLLVVHFFGPACVMALGIGWPIWKLVNMQDELSTTSPSAFYLLSYMNVVTGIIGVCSLLLMTNFLCMKALYQHKRPQLLDIIFWICAPVATIIYIYLPILIAQTVLFTQDSVTYNVTHKPSATNSLLPLAGTVIEFPDGSNDNEQ